MQPLRDRTASFGIYPHSPWTVVIHTSCFVIAAESGHEENEDEVEDGNPAMNAGESSCLTSYFSLFVSTVGQ